MRNIFFPHYLSGEPTLDKNKKAGHKKLSYHFVFA